MSIRIENLDERDFSDVVVASGRRLPSVHPGEHLAEILTELGLSQAAFARAIRVSPMRVSHVVKGARPVTAELALLFGRAFGQSPQYWLNLQVAYDLKTAEKTLMPRLRAIRILARRMAA